MDKRFRNIYFYDVILETKATGLDNPPKEIRIDELLKQMRAVYKNLSPFGFDKNSVWFSIEEWNFDDNKKEHHLLINKSDRNKSDPMFSDAQTKQRRRVKKNQGEGDETSSHVILQLQNDPRKLLMLVERGSLAGTNYIEKIFAKMVKTVKSNNDLFKAPHPDNSKTNDGKQRMVTLYAHFHMDGHLSNSFIKDLENGSFIDACLISEKNRNQLVDTAGNYRIEYEEQKITLMENKLFTIAGLKNAFAIKSKDYPTARLRLKRPNGKERTTVVETDTFHEVNYVRKEIIHADGGVSFDSAYDKINRDIICIS